MNVLDYLTDPSVVRAGKQAADEAREERETLAEQLQYVIEHEGQSPDTSLVNTEVMCCDHLLVAIFDLFGEDIR